ncbi:MAG: SDR family oxidoreductase [Christiangramia sp.]|nr:SDR family oxidoreductase [Christiangramia sp.]
MKKNILLIGGSTGIGKEIAKRMANDNKVIIASRNDIQTNEENIQHLKFDVLEDDITKLELPDTLHSFIYCPGSIDLRPFKMLKPEQFEKEMNLNFFGLVRSLHGVLDKLKKADQASLIFFSTVAVKTGMPFHTSVAAAKGAIEGFAKSLAAEYAPSFRVNVIAPSLTDTPMAEKLLASDEKKKKMDARHPLKRTGTTKDIASLATYLISEESSWMTGQVLGLDGGLSTLNIN